ncbi:MAG: hypothetical protein HY810_07145 [Candidatus Omnitrophica bacterium]|nr:hypothetical protein [Candidatus Omnitrophota bacterium]
MTLKIKNKIQLKKPLPVILWVLAINFFVHRFELLNQYCVYPDVWPHFIIYGLKDKTLFAQDVIMQSIRANINISEAIFPVNKLFLPGALFFSSYFNLNAILTLHSIIYSLVFAVFIYYIGCIWFQNGKAQLFSLSIMLYSLTMDTFFGGGIRGIGMLISAGILLAMLKEQWIMVCILMPATYFFYLPLLPFICCCAFINIFVEIKAGKPFYKEKMSTFFLIAGIMGIILANNNRVLFTNLPEVFVWKSKIGQADHNPIFLFIMNYLLNAHEHSRLYGPITLFIIAGVVGLFIAKKLCYKDILFAEKQFFYAMVLSFLFCNFIDVGAASRQLIFTVPVIISVIFCRYLLTKQVGAFILQYFCVFFLVINLVRPDITNDLVNEKSNKLLYERISGLDRNVLILSHPQYALPISFFTKRTVFNNWRLLRSGCIRPFIEKRFFEETKRRMELSLQTLYANSEDAIKQSIRENGITHIMVDTYYYSNNYLGLEAGGDDRFKKHINNILKQKNPQHVFMLEKMAVTHGQEVLPGKYLIEAKSLY